MKIKNLLCSLTILSGLMYVTSCGTDDGPKITTLEDIVLEEKTVAYDGQEHSIEVNGLPKGWTVTYSNNNKVNPGQYYVEAKITDKDGNNYSKFALLTIEKAPSVLQADAHQEAYAVPGVGVSPTFTLDNTSQKVNVEKYYRPGTYVIDLFAPTNTIYKESNHVQVTFVVKEGNELGITFNSKEVEANGEEHELLAENIPQGYSVKYTNNKGTKQGKYNASCDVYDSSNNKVMTLNAILTIDNPKYQPFEEYLDQFFVEYLGNDYISWNILTVDPANFGFVRDHTDIATWYTYESYGDNALEESYNGMLESKSYLTEYENAPLSYEQRISYVVIEELIDSYLEEYNPENNFDPYMNSIYIDQFGGYAAEVTTYMEAYELRTKQDIEDVITILDSIKDSFASYITYAEDKANAGYPYSDYTLDAMITYLEDVADDGADYYLYDYLYTKIDGCSYLTETEIEEYKQRVKSAIDNSFMPGHTLLAEGLEQFKGRCPEDKEHYWASYGEQGKEFYIHSLKDLLGMKEFNVEEYGQYLQDSVSKYQKQINRLIGKIRSLASNNPEAYDKFNTYLNGASIVGILDPNLMIDYLKEFATTIVPELDVTPEITVKYMDPSVASVSNALAYYMKSPLDSEDSEHITLNGEKLNSDNNEALSTMAHEGYPGHLYAYLYSKQLDISNVAKIMTSTAHAEGWATYVEYKLWEYMKTHNNALNDADLVAIELMCDYMQCNNILAYLAYANIDFNIFVNNWTVNDCAKFLDRIGFNAEAAEDIYLLLIESPASYHAYGYGRSYFVDLHERAQKELGTVYDELSFNSALLSHGWCSYDELNKIVDEYIAEQKFLYGLD